MLIGAINDMQIIITSQHLPVSRLFIKSAAYFHPMLITQPSEIIEAIKANVGKLLVTIYARLANKFRLPVSLNVTSLNYTEIKVS